MKILLVDDEPFHLRWLAENLKDEGHEVYFKRDVRGALEDLRNNTYRIILVDLNLPIEAADKELAAKRGSTYDAFPGLLVAAEARNSGYRSRQVVLYSAHKESTVSDEARILGINYLLKQDPRKMMTEIEDILSYDPTEI